MRVIFRLKADGKTICEEEVELCGDDIADLSSRELNDYILQQQYAWAWGHLVLESSQIGELPTYSQP